LGPESRRILLATVVSVGILIAWQFLNPAPKKPVEAQREKPVATQPATPTAGESKPGSPVAPAPALAPETPEETVTLTSAEFDVTFSSHGGGLKSIVLKGDKFRREVEGRTVQIDLVTLTKGQPYPLALAPSAELGGSADLATNPAVRAPMRIASRDARSVVFEGKVGALDVRKTYRLTGKPFELSLEIDVAAAPAKGNVALLYSGFMPPKTKGGGLLSGPSLAFTRPVCRGGDTTERFDPKGDDPNEILPGATAWAGMDQNYFIAAALPAEVGGTCVLGRGATAGSSFSAIQLPVEGAGRKLAFTVYAGPKDLDTLRGYGRGFETAVDYGKVANFFSFFARILLYVMRWFEEFVRNWGIAIILLTVLVKALLYPLTVKSMQSMNEMRKLQPEIEKLKAKFGADREKMNQAVMQLYQAHKVNPLGGCLPMLLQMPIWFALYATLQTSVELYREPFLWVHDLTAHDPFFILPLAMGGSMFIMQKISPQPADNTQAKMMLYFFPIFFTFLMLFLPAGLTLYIFVNNVLSIVQQQVLLKRSAVPAPAKG
jgi:YidC/Oxa1 family membrane protein insertase